MGVNKKELEKALLKLSEGAQDKAADLWIDLTKKAGVVYTKEDNGKNIVLKPENEKEAMEKNYGSGTKDIKAEFWLDETIRTWKKEVEKIK